MKKYFLVFILMIVPTLTFAQYRLLLNFKSMTPYVGELFNVRVVEVERNLEVGRTFVPGIASADFSVILYVLISGKSYRVDFYADHNSNGQYDAPPVDHAWSITTGQVNGDTELEFTHNTNFNDIAYPQPIVISSLSDTWTGKWVNPTFSAEGDVNAVFNFDVTSQMANVEWQAYNVFGLPDPLTFSMQGTLGSEPFTATFVANSPWVGSVALFDGQITGGISYADRGIVAVVDGNYGSHQLIAHYVMTGSVNAEEYAVVGREVKADVQISEEQPLFDHYALFANFPNPFNATTSIRFYLKQQSPVSLKVFDAIGQEIVTLVDGSLSQGYHALKFTDEDLPSGIYLYQLVTKDFIQTRKMVLIK